MWEVSVGWEGLRGPGMEGRVMNGWNGDRSTREMKGK